MSVRAKSAKPVVFDSFALIAFTERQPGWEVVRQTLRDLSSAHLRATICLINWGEIYYTAIQRRGLDDARLGMKTLARLPLEIAPIDQALTAEAAEIKGQRTVSYADAFCVATAQKLGACVLTGDPEFEQVEDMIEVIWLPQRRKRKR